ncbi:MAG TPA: MFS transporter [Pseudonocardia sp.]|nr:MFS transporter [Pseudonocardia sp.]
MRDDRARAGLFAGAFLGPFGGGITVAMLPELGSSYGVSAAVASTSITAYLLPFAGLMLVSGTLGERWGRRRTVVSAYVVYVLASLACVLAAGLGVFLVARAVQGAANAFTTPLLLAALAATVPPERLGRTLGWFGALQAAGQTSAPLLGGLAAEVDWRLAFGGVAVVALVLAVLGVPSGRARPAGVPAAGLRTAWRPEVLRIGVVAAVGWGCVAGLAFMVALRLEDDLGLGAGPRGLVLTVLGVAGILTARLVGGGVDRVGPRRSVLAGAVLGALVLAGAGLAPTVGAVVAAWALGGVATQLVLVGLNALVLGSAGANPSGSISTVQAVRFGGGALAPVAFTPVYAADPVLGFLLPAALLVVVVPLALPPAPPSPDMES